MGFLKSAPYRNLNPSTQYKITILLLSKYTIENPTSTRVYIFAFFSLCVYHHANASTKTPLCTLCLHPSLLSQSCLPHVVFVAPMSATRHYHRTHIRCLPACCSACGVGFRMDFLKPDKVEYEVRDRV